MIVGKTYASQDLTRWHYKFIWWPHRLQDGRLAFLTTVQRQWVQEGYTGELFHWEYKADDRTPAWYGF